MHIGGWRARHSPVSVRAEGLGKRYGRRSWALRGCTLELPQGAIVGLVGVNGAGKTTLLQLAIGLLTPTEGAVYMFGEPLRGDRSGGLAQVGFVAPDHPLDRTFSTANMLHFGRSMNPGFDSAGAERRLDDLGIPPRRNVGRKLGLVGAPRSSWPARSG